jgi:hypothetical protein
MQVLLLLLELIFSWFTISLVSSAITYYTGDTPEGLYSYKHGIILRMPIIYI